MQEYYFLFALALLWTLFATFQDLKQREVANWLNFSLIAFALAFRAFYAITNSAPKFFILGIIGLAIFVGFAYAFYYSKVFAGGDAKLLMGYGIILPYTTYTSIIFLSLAFILLLFTTGALYSIIYGAFIALNNKTKFKKEFSKKFNKNKNLIIFSSIIFAASLLIGIANPISLVFSPIFLLPILFLYAHSLEKCMLVLTKPNKLTEGDWIEHDIKLARNKTIKKTVHGLSKQDIALLKKYKKSIIVKQGIPFVPAFLISLIITIILFIKFQGQFAFLEF